VTARGVLSVSAPPAVTRAASLLVVLALALSVSVVVAGERERSALPGAARELRLAVIEAAGIGSCLQGVQDELYLPGQGRDQTAVAVAAARARLSTCGTGALEHDIAAIRLPPDPPVTTGEQRRARASIVAGLAALHLADLAARGAVRAMRTDIAGDDKGAVVAIAYRSAATSTRRAQTLEERAIRELGIAP
jgi:hypothetical protein